jgi:hypothetical protein
MQSLGCVGLRTVAAGLSWTVQACDRSAHTFGPAQLGNRHPSNFKDCDGRFPFQGSHAAWHYVPPAAHGVLRLVLEMNGEVVQRADPHIGYKGMYYEVISVGKIGTEI